MTGVETALRGVAREAEGAEGEEESELGAAGGREEPSAAPSTVVDDDDDSCCPKAFATGKGSGSSSRDICCICMESEAAVILPCYHSFCETCVDAWVASRRSTCPLCRAKMGTKHDRWQVIEELPPDFDVKTEIGRAMLHMAEKCGKTVDD